MSFEQIYQAARNHDAAELKTILKDYHIDVSSFRGALWWLTPAAKLAFEGNIKAAEFLLKHGAGVEQVLQAAAMAGNRKYVNELFLRYPILTTVHAIMGAAQAGNETYTDELVLTKKGIEQHVGHIGTIDTAAHAAARGGHIAFTEKLLKAGAKISGAIDGAAEGGYFTYLDEILERYAKQYKRHYKYAASSAAMCGHIKKAKELHRYLEPLDYYYLAYNAARGNHLSYVHELLAANDNLLKKIVGGAVTGRHVIRSKQSILRFFTSFPKNYIDAITKLLASDHTLFDPVKESPETVNRKDEPTFFGILYMPELPSGRVSDRMISVLGNSSRKERRLVTTPILPYSLEQLREEAAASTSEPGLVDWLIYLPLTARDINMPYNIMILISQFYSPVERSAAGIRMDNRFFVSQTFLSEVSASNNYRAIRLFRECETPSDVDKLIKNEVGRLKDADDSEYKVTVVNCSNRMLPLPK